MGATMMAFLAKVVFRGMAAIKVRVAGRSSASVSSRGSSCCAVNGIAGQRFVKA
jgi:hypothetical protein